MKKVIMGLVLLTMLGTAAIAGNGRHAKKAACCKDKDAKCCVQGASCCAGGTTMAMQGKSCTMGEASKAGKAGMKSCCAAPANAAAAKPAETK